LEWAKAGVIDDVGDLFLEGGYKNLALGACLQLKGQAAV